MNVRVIILAAGQGTRMRSALPKVLHPLAGKPLLEHVIDAAETLADGRVHVVYGHGGEAVRAALDHRAVAWVEQTEQLGTGHAVDQARDYLLAGEIVVILYGDVPLIQSATLERLVSQADASHLALMTVTLDDATGYGRIVRDDRGEVTRIVEHKDADDEERTIQEINTGILAVEGGRLASWLGRLDNKNSQGEYYLTDVIAMAVADGVAINTVQPDTQAEVSGINDRVQLAALEREYQLRGAEALMRSGVTLADPARIDVRGSLVVGRDSYIDVNLVVQGRVELGEGVHIGPNCQLIDCTVADGVTVLSNCVIEEATIGPGSRIGPFARIRPETELAGNAHVGNFVEIKKSTVGDGSKINHLSYIGDSVIGSQVNIGAGTITCNYDGANKHQTVIGNGAFIGSDTQLVAPVEVGEGATIGAGATITRNAPAGELTLSRVAQETRKGWKRPVKKPKQ